MHSNTKKPVLAILRKTFEAQPAEVKAGWVPSKCLEKKRDNQTHSILEKNVPRSIKKKKKNSRKPKYGHRNQRGILCCQLTRQAEDNVQILL